MTPENNILIVTPRMEELAALCRSNTLIEAGLYREYDVKRGLRDVNGKGVLAGLTNISDIIAQREVDGILQPCPGELYYRGIRIEELVQGFVREGRKGYEEVAYLLLFGSGELLLYWCGSCRCDGNGERKKERSDFHNDLIFWIFTLNKWRCKSCPTQCRGGVLRRIGLYCHTYRHRSG